MLESTEVAESHDEAFRLVSELLDNGVIESDDFFKYTVVPTSPETWDGISEREVEKYSEAITKHGILAYPIGQTNILLQAHKSCYTNQDEITVSVPAFWSERTRKSFLSRLTGQYNNAKVHWEGTSLGHYYWLSVKSYEA